MSVWELHGKKRLKVLGIMSGTSMNGLDLCLAAIERNRDGIATEILNFEEIEFSDDFRAYLKSLPQASASLICEANFKIAREYVRMIRAALAKDAGAWEGIDLIGSHGQTVWHRHRDSTLQIGEAAVLAEELNVPVVSDFRVRDVAAGGSGAPLVPIVDFYHFGGRQKTFLVLNIGGIANFTYVPKTARTVSDIRALDTGPGNALIDAAVWVASEGRESYDQDGQRASAGQLRDDILAQLLAHPYLQADLPKSTGTEVFGIEMVRAIIRQFGIGPSEYNDLIATLTAFTVEAIWLHYERYFAHRSEIDEVVVSGGGLHNQTMMQQLRERFAPVPVHSADAYGIQSDAKEAFAFAVLAALTIWGLDGNVPAVTGARHPAVLGKISQ